MAYTTPRVWGSGAVTSTDLNNYVSTPLTELQNALQPASTTWSPVLYGGTTAVTGTTATGQYMKFGLLVVANFQITLGSSVGSGNYVVGLPVPQNTGWQGTSAYGQFYANAAAGKVTGVCTFAFTGSGGGVQMRKGDGTLITAASPAFASGDVIYGGIQYMAAS